MCNSKLRGKFLRIIASDNYILSNASCRNEALMLKWLLRRSVSVRKLRISKLSAPYIHKGVALAKVTQSTNELALWELSLQDQESVNAVLQVSSSLQTILVCGGNLNDEVYFQISRCCSALHELNLVKVSVSYGVSLQILQTLTQLTALELGYGTFTNAAMLQIAYCCPQLTSFTYDECWCTDKSEYQAKSLSCGVLTTICSMCTQLKHLRLQYEFNGRCSMGLSVVYHAIALRLLQLRTLEINNVTITDNIGASLGFNNLFELRSITIEATRLSNEAFMQLLYRHPQLRSVSLYNNNIISGVNATHLTLQPNKLRYLRLHEFTALTDAGMRCILQACHKINNLSISSSRLITPEGVVPMILQFCPRMRNVYFSECIHFTQTYVDTILTRLASKLFIGVDRPGQGYSYDTDED